jgi:hypothetical protein
MAYVNVMVSGKFIARAIALVTVVAITLAGVYLYRKQHPITHPAESNSSMPVPTSKRAEAPSFDVVRIEPSGESVLAGRAEPGWRVSIEDRGTKLAEATADGEGAWTIVLEAPLAPGEHSLSITAVSPNGARSIASDNAVPVTLAKPRVAAMEGPPYEAERSTATSPDARRLPSRR